MMTLKLVALSPISRTRIKAYIIEAEAFTTYVYEGGYQTQITAHNSGMSVAFYVGNRPHDPEVRDESPSDPPQGEMWWDKAYIENSLGKTVEIISHDMPNQGGSSRLPGQTLRQ